MGLRTWRDRRPRSEASAPPDHLSREAQLRAIRVDSAETTLTGAQLFSLGIAIAMLVLSVFVFGWLNSLIVVLAAVTVLYVVMFAFKTMISGRSLRFGSMRVSPDEIAAVQAHEWPAYTILVPLYREAGLLPELVEHLDALDYPASRKQVLLLLEADDHTTLRAARSLTRPPNFEIVIIETSGPRTKPKACNIGLERATGDYCVIYDAEDRPELDQLKKAAVAFRALSDDVACVQAKLAYWNPDRNMLTRLGAAEYATYFELILPGLANLGFPVPLGGTSNHFRMRLLRAVGGWDPYNVTEDLDIGVRLARARLGVEILESVTWEEANCQLGNWVRQRSRWIKGHIQTYFVHMRSPLRLFRDLGPTNFVAFQLLVMATPFTLLMNPVVWAMTVAYVFTRSAFIQQLYPTPVFYLGVLSMVVGNLGFAYYAMTGCMIRRMYVNVRWTLLGCAPYWALMSVAAWKAAYQAVARPHYWEKTNHGLDRFVPQAPPPAQTVSVSSVD